MSGSVIHSQSAARVPAVYSAGQSPQLPVVIDYPAALALRQMSMVHDELPKYLLAPEVSALLHYVPDLRRKMLLATLPHTFRHSYAMHMLYAGIPLKVLQSLMGHKSISSTEVYTKVFALDVAARHRVQFSMPESDAVTMLKNRHA